MLQNKNLSKKTNNKKIDILMRLSKLTHNRTAVNFFFYIFLFVIGSTTFIIMIIIIRSSSSMDNKRYLLS